MKYFNLYGYFKMVDHGSSYVHNGWWRLNNRPIILVFSFPLYGKLFLRQKNPIKKENETSLARYCHLVEGVKHYTKLEKGNNQQITQNAIIDNVLHYSTPLNLVGVPHGT